MQDMSEVATVQPADKAALTPLKAVALGFAAMQVGPCLAGVPTLLQQFGGPGSWISAIVTLCIALMIARAITTFASRYVVDGSLISYAEISFGKLGEHVVAVSLMLGYFGLIASLVNDEVYYLTSLLGEFGLPQSSSFTWQCGLSFAAAAFTAFFAYKGPDLSAKVSGTLAAISLPVVVAIMVLAFATHQAGFSRQFDVSSYDIDGIIEGAIWGLAIYVGFDGLTSVASDTENPKKYVPAILTAIVLFFGFTLSLGSIFQYSLLAPRMEEILAGRTAISVFTEQAGLQDYATFVDFILCAATTASAIAFFNFGARIVSTSARDGMLPSILGRIDPKTHAPRPAIVLVGFIGSMIPIVLRLGGSVTPLEAITTLGSVLIYFWLLPYCVICLGAVVVLRRIDASRKVEMIMPALGVVSILMVLVRGTENDWLMPATAVAILATILGLIKIYTMTRREPRAVRVVSPTLPQLGSSMAEVKHSPESLPARYSTTSVDRGIRKLQQPIP